MILRYFCGPNFQDSCRGPNRPATSRGADRWSRFRVDDQSFGIRARHFGRYGCPMTRTENSATINAMERRNSLRLVVIVAISAIAVGLQAADEQNADYTVRILALPDHGQANITMD